ncbi:hypothetical protein PsorP6_014996 [Peronosclerospora sorghi]|uniref:Uncharacterized protein n=1 Tax=Peronosclerospora sorghi TaxID=230839 RepID=A0ACC0VTE2_9STRA|nr:hypothetical protein PsorP6_014996 [Peronosclerospora sorghi]
MTPGAIRARERRAALRKRAVVKDNSDGNANGEVCSYTDDDKGDELNTDDHKGAKRDSGESKFNNNNTKCEAACSDVAIVRKGGERDTADGKATEHKIDDDQGAECETNGNKGAERDSGGDKDIERDSGGDKDAECDPDGDKGAERDADGDNGAERELGMAKITTTTPTVKQLGISMYVYFYLKHLFISFPFRFLSSFFYYELAVPFSWAEEEYFSREEEYHSR